MSSGKEDNSNGDSLSEEETSTSTSTSTSQSRGSCEPDVKDVCGKQQKSPRIGNEYQVEIPPFVEPLQQMKSLYFDAGTVVDVADSLVLPVPIIWINNDIGRHHAVESKNTKPIKKSSNTQQIKAKRQDGGVSFAAPGCLSNSWTDLEKEAFLLGLYIFGKSLVKVKRFVESKAMSDILSFYYGEFYRSTAHRRWSSSRNKDKRSRRCIQGPKMFKTWRQQKFLSCLLPRVTEKCYSTLVEASKSFEASVVSLEDYVSTVKATIGLEMLVEVFGIGKGKQDLTSLIINPARNNQVIYHPELPAGKDCSTLTYDEIAGILTGDYRLSKARSNDLFWEAIWPRLLARGWQSKQPKNYTGSSRNPLVFMVPGVEKFSRKKLVKGKKYFDSVSDVLTKVASDPTLIRLEDDPVKENIGSQENDWGNKKMKLDNDGESDHKRRSYLQPEPPESKSDLRKFTVIDTSMGEDSFPVRQLKSLPAEITETSSPESLSSQNENGSKELVIEKGAVDKSLNCTRNTSTSRSAGSKTEKEVRSEELVVEKGAVDKSLNCTRNTSTSRSAGSKTDKEVRSTELVIEKGVVDKSLNCTRNTSTFRSAGSKTDMDVRSEELVIEKGAVDKSLNCSRNTSTSRSPGSKTDKELLRSKELVIAKGVVDKSLNCTRNTVTSRSPGKTDKEVRSGSGSLKFIITISKKEMQIKAPVCADVSLRNDIDENTRNPEVELKKQPIKCQFSRRKKPSQSNCVSPVLKRRRLTACSEAKVICSKDSSSSTHGLREEGPNSSDNMVYEVKQFEENVCSSSSGSPDENFFGGKYISQKEKYPPRVSIDLNLPHVPSNLETDEPFIKGVEIRQRGPTSKHPASHVSGELSGAEQQPPDLGTRRQGTRKRPLTTKALEALACGFLATKRKAR